MRRSVSQKLMSAPAVAPGERLWVPRDGAWDGAEHELDLGFGELHRANGPGGGVGGSYDDATAMRHLNEPELLHTRYLADEAYTRVGTVLVAVNPLKAIPQPRMRAYADAAFGGAGKTETSKIVLAYLAWRGGGDDAGASLSEALDAVAPALEAFGNAATSRNPNSSRFGKFLKLYFDGDGRLRGGGLETYLLEAPGESNYHALYTLRRLKGMTPLGECRVLPGGFAYSDKAPRDKAVNAALELLIQGDAVPNSTTGDASAVWRVCAAVVHLGDVLVFGEDRGQIDQHPGCPFELFARNLGFDAHFGDEVARSLAETVVRTRGESFCRALTPAQTQLAVQALARHLYGRLFDALVAACDERLRRDAAGGNPVGVLDVFGFEAFEVNGFETLLINYANEALQQHFCDAVFAAELRLFEAEGLERPDVPAPPDSGATLEFLVAARPPGVLRLLDAACATATGDGAKDDAKFLASVHRDLARHPLCRIQPLVWVVLTKLQNSLSRSNRRHPAPRAHPDLRRRFTVRHYAAHVAYDVCGGPGAWTKGNVDGVDADFLDLAKEGAQLPFAARPAPASKTSRKKPTVASTFVKSMQALHATLKACDCGFIRCVKPAPMRAGDFARGACQLRALGLLAACEVLKVGLPTRVPYGDVVAKLPGDAAAFAS
ncbi:hypothetical protein JL720_4000 [Aureococcus anophagefferens]|nr:hypothetical protein JL720_4000 [Aureococcus anophagefferens]